MASTDECWYCMRCSCYWSSCVVIRQIFLIAFFVKHCDSFKSLVCQTLSRLWRQFSTEIIRSNGFFTSIFLFAKHYITSVGFMSFMTIFRNLCLLSYIFFEGEKSRMFRTFLSHIMYALIVPVMRCKFPIFFHYIFFHIV